MPTRALVGAIVGAVLGAVVWAAIVYFTGYEVGYVAWGVGAAVGGLAAKFGSSGSTAGLTCAALALVAIFAGKVIAANLVIRKELEKEAAQYFDRDLHTELMEDARLFAALGSEEDYPKFMFDRRYTEAASVDQVQADEIAAFKANNVPDLRAWHRDAPGFETWARKHRKQSVDAVMDGVSMVDVVTENLGLMDILFGVLGVATAFKLGEGLGATGDYGGGGGQRPPAPPQPPQPPQGSGGPASPPAPGSGQAPVRRRRPR